MDILEKEIEDIIFEMYKDKSEKCYNLGSEPGLILRQVKSESNGISDLINIKYQGTEGGSKRIWHIDIIELKRGIIGYEELGQICRYTTAARRFVKSLKSKKDVFEIRGLLIGKSINYSGDFCFILDCLKDIDVFTFVLDHETGIEFDEQSNRDWFKSGESFKPVKSLLETEKLIQEVKEFISSTRDERLAYKREMENGSI